LSTSRASSGPAAIADRADAGLDGLAAQRVGHLLREEVGEALEIAAEPRDGL